VEADEDAETSDTERSLHLFLFGGYPSGTASITENKN